MSEENARLIQRQLRSPRSAAIAGILFSLLMGTSMFLMFDIGTTTPADINRDWLETWSSTTSIVLPLVPFAGIAFLWFTGVIRDRLGDREDRFFATIFFGSGIIVVVMMFTWAATIGALFRTHAAAADLLADNDIFIFGFTLPLFFTLLLFYLKPLQLSFFSSPKCHLFCLPMFGTSGWRMWTTIQMTKIGLTGVSS